MKKKKFLKTARQKETFHTEKQQKIKILQAIKWCNNNLKILREKLENKNFHLELFNQQKYISKWRGSKEFFLQTKVIKLISSRYVVQNIKGSSLVF